MKYGQVHELLKMLNHPPQQVSMTHLQVSQRYNNFHLAIELFQAFFRSKVGRLAEHANSVSHIPAYIPSSKKKSNRIITYLAHHLQLGSCRTYMSNPTSQPAFWK